MESDSVPSILCHPDAQKSCGACCGMYNHVDFGADALGERLVQRTRAFRESAEITDPESLKAFRRTWEDQSSEKLLKDLPSCPFLGFVDDSGEKFGRVGCMVHPLQNEGVDGRDCGVYDRFICEDYLCAAHDILKTSEIRLILDAVDDSYLYGLVITNPRFVRSLFDIIASRSGESPTCATLRRPDVIEAAGACFELMRDWPHRGADGIFGQVEVDGPLETRRRRLPAEDLGVEREEIDILLVCLGTECESVAELVRARQRMEKPLATLVETIRSRR